MARNEEKAQSMLNRWTAWKLGALDYEKRPTSSSSVQSIRDCEYWRRQILKEIGDKVSIIQNASLGEHRIRDLNDEINKLFKEKWHWERQIVHLGGPDYTKTRTLLEDQGIEISLSQKGYKYFGAAKNLPGVKEMFESKKLEEEAKKISSQDLYRGVDAIYYGLNDDDEALLEEEEAMAEKIAIEEEVKKWQSKTKEMSNNMRKGILTKEESKGLVAHVAIPTPEEVESFLLERRKAEFLKNLSNYVEVEQ